MATISKRQAAEAFILEMIDSLLPGSENKRYYAEKVFPRMSDAQFSQFMQDLRDGKQILGLIAPNLKGPRLDIKRNFEVAKKLGHKFHQRIVFGPTESKPGYITPIPYLVIKLPLRRQAQHLIKKIRIPEDNHSVDDFTGQPTGKSKGSKLSYPETQVLAALKLDATMAELLKYRGGDLGGFNAMNTMINRTGGVRLESIEPASTGVESTKTLKVFLTSMHLKVQI
jgi:hypothetical protein